MSSLRARLALSPVPLGSLGGAPPFRYNLPNSLSPTHEVRLRALTATYQVLPFDPHTLRHIEGSTGPTGMALVSTGEPLSVFPWHVWRDRRKRTPDVPGEFESHIIWCEPTYLYNPNATPHVENYPGPDGPNWYFRDRYRFQLGLIWVIVFDNLDEGHQLTPRRVLARFLLDASPDIPEPIFGLREGVVTNRRLHRVTRGLEHNQVPEEWNLYDGPDTF